MFCTIGALFFTGATFGEGIGTILRTSMQCEGAERALLDCTASSSGASLCTHAQDSGVRCQPGMG